MTGIRTMKPCVEAQLRLYRDNKLRLYQYNQRGLRQRSTLGIRSMGRAGNPTQMEALRQLEPPQWVVSARRWAWAIEQAYAMLQKTAPKKAILMDKLYGIERPVRHPTQPRVTMLLLVSDLNVSEPTLYKWREEVLSEVMAAAIQAGALQPYDSSTLFSQETL